MNHFKSNSGQHIVFIDHSTSGIGASINQSSADPTSLANIMRQSLIVTNQIFVKSDISQENKESSDQNK